MRYINMIRKRKINCKGFSLVELLIVIAILAIAVGLAGISIAVVFSRDAERCAKTIDAALEETRMRSLSQNGTFSVGVNAATNECIITTFDEAGALVATETTSLQSRVTISYEMPGGADLTSTEVVAVGFDKSTGRVRSIAGDGGAAAGSVLRIRCVSDNGKVATVVLVRSTGKHYVDYST